MSTTNTNTDTATVQWQSESDLSRSNAALISSHWDEVIQNIVPPGVAWSWGECGVSHRLKYNWKHSGLIRRAPDGRRWMTTEALWLHVIERAGDGEHVGREGRGQELLPVDTSADSGSSRVLADTAPDRPKRRTDRQATLGGDSVPVSDVTTEEKDHPAINRAKGEVTPSKADIAAHDAAQTTLNTVELHDLDAWDVTVPWFRDPGVTTPEAAVY